MPRRPWFFDPYPHVLGGAQRTAVRLAAGLRADGADARLILPDAGKLAELADASGVPVEVLPTPATLRGFGRSIRPSPRVGAAVASYSFSLGRVLRRARVDLVHANDVRGALLAGPAAKLARRPLVWHVHSVEPPGFAMTAAARLANHVIVPSRAALAMVPASTRRGRVSVIGAALDERWLGVHTDDVEAGILTDLACVARFEPVKGVDILLDAMSILRTSRPELILTVVGTRQDGYDSYADAIESRAGAPDVTASVRLLGDVDPLPVVRGCRVYVQPSRSETFGMAVLEAMAVGCPVVVFAVGGLVELTDNGRAGVLVPPGDSGALAVAISKLLDEPERASAISAAARERAVLIGDPAAQIAAVRAVHESVTR